MAKRKKVTKHPGLILEEEFIRPMGLTQMDLARHVGWTQARVNEITRGRRGVSAASALVLGEVFGTGAKFWLDLQIEHELSLAAQKHSKIGRLKAKMKLSS